MMIESYELINPLRMLHARGRLCNPVITFYQKYCFPALET